MISIGKNDSGNFAAFKKNIYGTATTYELGEHFQLTELIFHTLEDDMILEFGTHKNADIYFIYNLKQGMSISYPKDKETTLSSFESAILYNINGDNAKFIFKKNRTFQLCIIHLDKLTKINNVNPMFSQFESIFNNLGNTDCFLDIGQPNLKICDQVIQLLEFPKESLDTDLMALGYVNIILSLSLRQYMESIIDPRPTSLLSKREIGVIQALTTQIINHPEESYGLDEMCKMSGLSACKLQEGFKAMHGFTVGNYICETRLKKAEELIKTTDLNISQIVYSIGYTSRSYFSKIFKEKYNCTPNNYKQQLTPLAVTA